MKGDVGTNEDRKFAGALVQYKSPPEDGRKENGGWVCVEVVERRLGRQKLGRGRRQTGSVEFKGAANTATSERSRSRTKGSKAWRRIDSRKRKARCRGLIEGDIEGKDRKSRKRN